MITASVCTDHFKQIQVMRFLFSDISAGVEILQILRIHQPSYSKNAVVSMK